MPYLLHLPRVCCSVLARCTHAFAIAAYTARVTTTHAHATTHMNVHARVYLYFVAITLTPACLPRCGSCTGSLLCRVSLPPARFTFATRIHTYAMPRILRWLLQRSMVRYYTHLLPGSLFCRVWFYLRSAHAVTVLHLQRTYRCAPDNTFHCYAFCLHLPSPYTLLPLLTATLPLRCLPHTRVVPHTACNAHTPFPPATRSYTLYVHCHWLVRCLLLCLLYMPYTFLLLSTPPFLRHTPVRFFAVWFIRWIPVRALARAVYRTLLARSCLRFLLTDRLPPRVPPQLPRCRACTLPRSVWRNFRRTCRWRRCSLPCAALRTCIARAARSSRTYRWRVTLHAAARSALPLPGCLRLPLRTLRHFAPRAAVRSRAAPLPRARLHLPPRLPPPRVPTTHVTPPAVMRVARAVWYFTACSSSSTYCGSCTHSIRGSHTFP